MGILVSPAALPIFPAPAHNGIASLGSSGAGTVRASDSPSPEPQSQLDTRRVDRRFHSLRQAALRPAALKESVSLSWRACWAAHRVRWPWSWSISPPAIRST